MASFGKQQDILIFLPTTNRLYLIQVAVTFTADSLTSFCKSVIVAAMVKMPLVLALILVGLPVGSVAQSGSVGSPSA